MGAHPIQTSFNGGEFAPDMYGQVNFETYQKACRVLENFIPLPQGPAQSRPGLKFIADAGSASMPAYVRPFISSNLTAYILEFGNYYLRFYKNQAQLLTSGSPYQISTPWAAADIPNLQFAQSADVMYITHPNYPVWKLSHYSDTVWTLTAVQWIDGPYLDPNLQLGIQLSASATSGTGVTISTQNMGISSVYDSSVFTPATPQAVMTPTDPYGGFRFKTGSTGNLISFQINLATAAGTSGDTATAHLYSDSAGSPGTSLATSANSPSITTPGLVVFNFNNHALAANTWYWICFAASTPDSAVTLSTVATAANFGSGVSATGFTSIADSMGMEFSGTVLYLPTGAASVFLPGHVGSIWRMSQNGPLDSEKFNEVKAGSPLEMLGTFSVDLTANSSWEGQINLEISYDLVNWFTAAVFTTSTTQDFTENRPGVWYRLNCVQYTSGNALAVLYQTQQWGVFLITAYVSASQVTATVISPIAAANSWTPFWSEAAWNAVRGYPGVVCFKDGRLYLAATAYQPTTLWGSWVADFENFTPGDTADAPVTFTLTEINNPIQWLFNHTQFLAGTIGEEVLLTPSGQGPITQTNPVSCRVQSGYGTQEATLPFRVGPSLMFVENGGQKLLAMAYFYATDAFQADDLTLSADHVGIPGFADMAYAKKPYSVLWLVRGDGQMAGLTYYPQEKIIGWCRLVTAGQILSVAVIPSAYGDTKGRSEVWVVVQRTIGGSTQICVEMMADFTTLTALSQFVCLDSAMIFQNSGPVSTQAGLDRFNGQSVGILADGMPQAQQVVSGGSITLDPPATNIVAGLPYTCTLQTLNPEIGMKDGTSQFRVNEVEKIGVRLLGVLSGQIGQDKNSLVDTPDLIPDVTLADSAAPFPFSVTDYISDGWPADSGLNPTVMIKQTAPLPVMVLAIGPVITVND